MSTEDENFDRDMTDVVDEVEEKKDEAGGAGGPESAPIETEGIELFEVAPPCFNADPDSLLVQTAAFQRIHIVGAPMPMECLVISASGVAYRKVKVLAECLYGKVYQMEVLKPGPDGRYFGTGVVFAVKAMKKVSPVLPPSSSTHSKHYITPYLILMPHDCATLGVTYRSW
jgi:hypothetical protein